MSAPLVAGEPPLPETATAEIRAHLPEVADRVVGAIIAEVPSYADAFSGPMGATIRAAVRTALGGFLSLASGRHGADAPTPTAPAVDGAYQLGRGEARNGRSTDAILAAYRIGARVSWREMSTTGVAAGLEPATLVRFAELVFAYIDELSAASVAGHTDELATSGRLRQRLRERLAQLLLAGASADAVAAAAERTEWRLPRSLTAVLVPEAQVRPVLTDLPAATLAVPDMPELDDRALLLVPDVGGRRRAVVLRAAAGRGGVVGPARPPREVRGSYERALRAHALGVDGDTEARLVDLVLTADADALADLRERALAPLADLRPTAAAKLTETLRAWLLHQGRRDDVAAALFVHPQTVRYRMGQLREAYGDRLEDPDVVLALTVALALDVPEASPGASPAGSAATSRDGR